jgi:hypothetical protein
MRWLVPEPVSGWPDLPPSVTVTTATAPDGRRLHIVHNWSFTPVQVCVPGDLRDLLADGNPTTPPWTWTRGTSASSSDRPVDQGSLLPLRGSRCRQLP